MNHSSQKSGKPSREGKFDALLLPSADTDNPDLEVTFFDQRIPFFDIDPNPPAEAPLQLPEDDAPAFFELMPDFTLDRSQRHFEVAPPSLTNTQSEPDVHIPVTVPVPQQPLLLNVNIPAIRDKLQGAPPHNKTTTAVPPELAQVAPAGHQFSTGTPNNRNNSLPPTPAGASPQAIPDIFPDQQHHNDTNPTPGLVKSQQPPPFYPFSPGIAANAVLDSTPNPEALEAAIIKLVQSIPLLNEEDMLETLAEPQHGGFTISPKTLKQALGRLGLETDYKRYRAYITG